MKSIPNNKHNKLFSFKVFNPKVKSNNILCNKLGNRERGQKEMNNVGFLFGGLVFKFFRSK